MGGRVADLCFAVQYTNVWNSQYMPYVISSSVKLIHKSRLTDIDRIMSRLAYDNTGQHYNVTKILRDDTTLDIDKYRAYSPLFLPYACLRLVLWIYYEFFVFIA